MLVSDEKTSMCGLLFICKELEQPRMGRNKIKGSVRVCIWFRQYLTKNLQNLLSNLTKIYTISFHDSITEDRNKIYMKSFNDFHNLTKISKWCTTWCNHTFPILELNYYMKMYFFKIYILPKWCLDCVYKRLVT